MRMDKKPGGNEIKNILKLIKCRPLCFACIIFLLLQLIRIQAGFIKAPPMVENNISKTVAAVGQLHKKEIKSKYQVLYLKQSQMHSEGQWCKISNIIIYDYTFADIKLGNYIQVRGEVELFQEARNPGNFDQRFYYAKQGIYGLVKAVDIKVIREETDVLAEKLARLREAWGALLYESAGEEAGGILDSVLLGNKGSMDEQVKELYQKCGIGHILAISGLHISFIGMGIYYILRRIGLTVWMAGITGVVLLWLYLMMIGCPVSALRAFIMYVLRMGAVIIGRKYDAPTALAFAAAFTIWRWPLYLQDAGFLLSYGAILGIICVLPLVDKLTYGSWKWLAGLKVSAAVNTVLFPLLLYFFFEFPVYSLILNMVVVPLMSVIMATALAGSVLWCISPAVGGVVFWVCRLIFHLFEWLCGLSVNLPFSRIVVGQPPMWRMILYYVFLFGFICVMWRRIKRKEERDKKNVRLVWEKGLSVVSIVFLMVTIAAGYSSHGELQVTMLDVGQGDGFFVWGPEGKTYFIDGGSSDVGQVGKYRIEPFLKSQGVSSLDYVFISHGDSDHMSGMMEMIERQALGVRIKSLVLPPQNMQDESLRELARIAVENGTAVYEMKAGDQVTEGEMQITCIQPMAGYAGEIGNASSMVLSLTYKEFDMLFTGDVEGEGEEILKKNLTGNRYDVLKAAHHGSKNSGDEEFLEMIKPSYTLISAGVGNRYGHPHAETIERLEGCGSRVYCTADQGAVILRTKGRDLKITVWLD